MIYTTCMIKINGVWEQVLVVASEKPQTFDGNTIAQSEGGVTTTYHTKGLYKEAEENGTYYYWFIVQSKEVVITDAEKIAVYEEALNTLGVETEETNAE